MFLHNFCVLARSGLSVDCMPLARSGPTVGPAHDRPPIRRAREWHLRHPAKSGSTREIPVHHATSRPPTGAGMPALASQPARPVCFVCSSSSEGGGGARWSSPTTRSVGRSAVAERAPNARIAHSTGGAVRVARDSRRCAEVWLFAFETTSLAVARRRSPRSA